MMAAERVELSRARLRAAMVPKPPATEAATGATSGPSAPSWWQTWWQRVHEFPMVRLLSDSVRAWWSRHPLRPVAQVAGDASNAAIRPLAQRNPVLLVLGAAAVGAGLAWLRPWRWLFGSALFAGLVPQVATQLVARMPIESWMNLISRASPRPSTRAHASPQPRATGSPPPL